MTRTAVLLVSLTAGALLLSAPSGAPPPPDQAGLYLARGEDQPNPSFMDPGADF